MNNGENPCNVCKVSECEGCIWDRTFRNKRQECYHDECMLNVDSSCLLDAYDDCYLLTGGAGANGE